MAGEGTMRWLQGVCMCGTLEVFSDGAGRLVEDGPERPLL